MSHFCAGFVYNVSVIGIGGKEERYETHNRTEREGREDREQRRSEEILEEAGITLDDAELDQVVGGAGWPWYVYPSYPR